MVKHRKEKPFKSKKFRDVPKDEWIVAENTHEPIIDKQTFDEVQKLLESRARETKTGETYQDITIYYKFVGTVEFNSELNIEKVS